MMPPRLRDAKEVTEPVELDLQAVSHLAQRAVICAEQSFQVAAAIRTAVHDQGESIGKMIEAVGDPGDPLKGTPATGLYAYVDRKIATRPNSIVEDMAETMIQQKREATAREATIRRALWIAFSWIVWGGLGALVMQRCGG